ncbi:MAG: hypothetical protein ACI8TS_001215, partial [Flavobacteriales bacterium]
FLSLTFVFDTNKLSFNFEDPQSSAINSILAIQLKTLLLWMKV